MRIKYPQEIVTDNPTQLHSTVDSDFLSKLCQIHLKKGTNEFWTNPCAWFEIQSCLQDSKTQVIVDIFNMTDCLTNYSSLTCAAFIFS